MSILKLLRLNVGSAQNFTKKIIFIRNYNDIVFEDIPDVSPAFIKKFLNDRKVSFDEGHTCFMISCTFCGKPTLKNNPKNLFINKNTGMFMCSSCKHTGQWDFIHHHFNLKGKDKTEILVENLDHQNALNESLQKIRDNSDLLVNNDKFETILQEFKLPVVVRSSFNKLDVRIDTPPQNMFFPLENVESEIVGYRRINSRTEDDLIIPHISYGGLLVGKALKNKDTAILVPSISDFLILLNAKVTQNVVCLPNGVNNLSQYVLPTLEKFKKLILWFGNDIKSWDSARHFSKKLGEKRCFFVRPTEKQLLPHLVEQQDFKAIINAAQPIWHKSITSFASLREDVYSDLRNIDKVEGVKWKRYPTLNKILKGHRRGELTVITGPTGCGKTTFISDYSLDLAMQGVNTLWGSFEIRNVRLARTMLQQFAGFPLDQNLNVFDKWADKFEKLPIYFMTFHGQQSIKIVMDAVEHATYVHDIAHVIIDNVQFMMGITEDFRHMDRFWAQDVIIAAFRSFATRKNCHVTLVIHPRKERDDEDLTTSSIFGGAKASQEADNVFIIQDKRLSSVRGKKYLQVCKNRYSGDLGIMPLDFDKASLSYSSKKKKEEKIDETSENKKQAKNDEKKALEINQEKEAKKEIVENEEIKIDENMVLKNDEEKEVIDKRKVAKNHETRRIEGDEIIKEKKETKTDNGNSILSNKEKSNNFANKKVKNDETAEAKTSEKKETKTDKIVTKNLCNKKMENDETKNAKTSEKKETKTDKKTVTNNLINKKMENETKEVKTNENKIQRKNVRKIQKSSVKKS